MGDQIKQEFPEHAATMAESEAARKKSADAEEAEKKKVAEKAKVLSGKFEKEISDVLKKASESTSKDLRERFEKQAKDVFGGESDESRQKMISKILETVTLGMRGLETKAKQKSDESLKEWAILETKKK